ncbi:MAG: phosphatidylglycerol lysyltransferase domain-containing protein [Bacteroidales bacterium]
MKSVIISLKDYQKTILQVAFGLLFVALGIYFMKHEIGELSNVRQTLNKAEPSWVLAGLFLLAAFVVVQGMMYQQSFRAIHERIKLSTGINLYLKRNLVSVFLPAGMLTNMLFFNESVERKDGVDRTQIYFASSIFSICSILSGLVVGIPALFWLVLKQRVTGQMVTGILVVAVFLGLIIAAVISFIKRGWIFHQLEKRAPAVVQVLNEMSQRSFSRRRFWMVVGLSMIIEVIGISHLWIAVKALGGTPTLAMSLIGYSIVLLLLMSSPFLRGIGAVEAALTYALTLFGFSTVMALSVAFLFRFFEFWAVLVLGLMAMVARRDNLVLRLLPALLLFLLGLINILSGITPALPERLESLSRLIPLGAIQASNWLVILSGIILLATSIYLFRGLRNAWIMAVVLTALSLAAHLTKGIDWEEASVALVTLASLIYQRHQYFVKPDLKLARQSFFPGIVAVFSVVLFGTLAFWFIHPRHFNEDFALWDSIRESFTTFFLFNDALTPVTPFGSQLINGMHILGGLTMIYCVYLLFRPLIVRNAHAALEDRDLAVALTGKYGKSSLDYFKTYGDKEYWFSEDQEGFVAFRTSRNFAIVLENPVCKDTVAMEANIMAFDAFCTKNGLRAAYYRIPETTRASYEKLGKKLVPVGEVAVVNLESWSLEGSSKRGIRNEVNKLTKTGFSFKVTLPPQKDGFLQQLKAVSEDWLKSLQRTELVFSQGMFSEKELKDQTILSVENPEAKVAGFVNLIPDHVPGEANFDLMRKTRDAPNGTMDFLFANMFGYLKSEGFKACNMGMVPMSGIDDPDNMKERILKLAYDHIRHFGHYKSLRAYKEKFEPSWQMMYLAYEAPYDLITLPSALENVFEPPH